MKQREMSPCLSWRGGLTEVITLLEYPLRLSLDIEIVRFCFSDGREPSELRAQEDVNGCEAETTGCQCHRCRRSQCLGDRASDKRPQGKRRSGRGAFCRGNPTQKVGWEHPLIQR